MVYHDVDLLKDRIYWLSKRGNARDGVHRFDVRGGHHELIPGTAKVSAFAITQTNDLFLIERNKLWQLGKPVSVWDEVDLGGGISDASHATGKVFGMHADARYVYGGVEYTGTDDDPRSVALCWAPTESIGKDALLSGQCHHLPGSGLRLIAPSENGVTFIVRGEGNNSTSIWRWEGFRTALPRSIEPAEGCRRGSDVSVPPSVGRRWP